MDRFCLVLRVHRELLPATEGRRGPAVPTAFLAGAAWSGSAVLLAEQKGWRKCNTALFTRACVTFTHGPLAEQG